MADDTSLLLLRSGLADVFGLFGRETTEHFFQLLLGDGPRLEGGFGAFLGSERHELARRRHDVRREEDHQLGLVVLLLLPLEEVSQPRDVAEQGDLALGDGLLRLHQATDDDGLAVGHDHHGVSDARVDDRREGILGDGHPLGPVRKLRGLGGDDHLDQAVLRNERRDAEDDADALVGDGVDLSVDRVEPRVADERDLLAEADGRRLVVAGEDGRPGEDLSVAGLRDGPERDLEIRAEQLVQAGAGRCLTDAADVLPYRVQHRVAGGAADAGLAEGIGELADPDVADVLGASAFDAEVEAVVVGDLEEHHFDQDLWPRFVEALDDLLDLEVGLLVGHDDDLAGLRVDGDDRLADLGVAGILAGRGAAAGAASRGTVVLALGLGEGRDGEQAAEQQDRERPREDDRRENHGVHGWVS